MSAIFIFTIAACVALACGLVVALVFRNRAANSALPGASTAGASSSGGRLLQGRSAAQRWLPRGQKAPRRLDVPGWAERLAFTVTSERSRAVISYDEDAIAGRIALGGGAVLFALQNLREDDEGEVGGSIRFAPAPDAAPGPVIEALASWLGIPAPVIPEDAPDADHGGTILAKLLGVWDDEEGEVVVYALDSGSYVEDSRLLLCLAADGARGWFTFLGLEHHRPELLLSISLQAHRRGWKVGPEHLFFHASFDRTPLVRRSRALANPPEHPSFWTIGRTIWATSANFEQGTCTTHRWAAPDRPGQVVGTFPGFVSSVVVVDGAPLMLMDEDGPEDAVLLAWMDLDTGTPGAPVWRRAGWCVYSEDMRLDAASGHVAFSCYEGEDDERGLVVVVDVRAGAVLAEWAVDGEVEEVVLHDGTAWFSVMRGGVPTHMSWAYLDADAPVEDEDLVWAASSACLMRRRMYALEFSGSSGSAWSSLLVANPEVFDTVRISFRDERSSAWWDDTHMFLGGTRPVVIDARRGAVRPVFGPDEEQPFQVFIGEELVVWSSLSGGAAWAEKERLGGAAPSGSTSGPALDSEGAAEPDGVAW